MDITKIMEKTYELADALKKSDEYELYLKYEETILLDANLRELIESFNQKKAKFEEAFKYGKHYPGFDKIKHEYQEAKIQLMNNETFKKYKAYEKEIDLNLYQVEHQLKQLLNIEEKHNNSTFKFL